MLQLTAYTASVMMGCVRLQGRRTVRAAVGMGCQAGLELNCSVCSWAVCKASAAQAAFVTLIRRLIVCTELYIPEVHLQSWSNQEQILGLCLFDTTKAQLEDSVAGLLMLNQCS